MSDLEKKAKENMRTHFVDNPCRGIVLGMNEEGEAMQLAWIMGRSPNSKNRVYTVDGGAMKTEAADPSKVEDPSLIIYKVMGSQYGLHVVSNGDQTDTVLDAVSEGGRQLVDEEGISLFYNALNTRRCEPDEPNFTPRITGAQYVECPTTVLLSVLKADPIIKELWKDAIKKSGIKKEDFKSKEEYDKATVELTGFDKNDFPTVHDSYERYVRPGFGYCLTTYMSGSQELPSFEGEPVLVPMKGSLHKIMRSFYNKLETKYRVALGGKMPTTTPAYAEPINRFKKRGGK